MTKSIGLSYRGLSCYTAGLAAYLSAEWDADVLLARSVRLAVRTDLPGRLEFSHHARPLDQLPDGTGLRYVAAADPVTAFRAIAAELQAHGRVIVMANNAALPWSPVASPDAAAPHWLLVNDRRGEEWHVVDAFSGLLAAGEQEPFDGWIPSGQMRAGMTLPRWNPQQWARNRLAFGFPVPMPVGTQADGTFCWLHRGAPIRRCAVLPGRWLTSDATACSFLAAQFADAATAGRYLDDCWAAAGHRSFAYRWLLAHNVSDKAYRKRIENAIDRWQALPRALRFAVESAYRGRPRPSLIEKAFGEVLQADPGAPQELPGFSLEG